MRRFRSRRVELFALVFLLGCPRAEEPAAPAPSAETKLFSHSPLPALPPPPSPSNPVADDPAAARLGHALFFERRFSPDGTISCATCHDPRKDWTNGAARGRGLGAIRTPHNVPSLWHVAWHRWFNWDGRFDTLWAQALKPLLDPDEMGSSAALVSEVMARDAELAAAYARVFGALPASGSPETALVDVARAIEAFQRTLTLAPAPFDRHVAALRSGDRAGLDAISPAAQRGARLFVGKGRCDLCHTGPLFTDREFHNLGLDAGTRDTPDPGRFAGIAALLADPNAGRDEKVRYLRQRPVNLGEFKTPSLRNVARTAPYMHDGRFETLADVVRFYSKLDQVPALGHREETLVALALSEGEIADLVAFLESLTSEPADPAVVGRGPARPAGSPSIETSSGPGR